MFFFFSSNKKPLLLDVLHLWNKAVNGESRGFEAKLGKSGLSWNHNKTLNETKTVTETNHIFKKNLLT